MCAIAREVVAITQKTNRMIILMWSQIAKYCTQRLFHSVVYRPASWATYELLRTIDTENVGYTWCSCLRVFYECQRIRALLWVLLHGTALCMEDGLVHRLVVISNVVRNDMPAPWRTCCFVDQCVMSLRQKLNWRPVTNSFSVARMCNGQR